MAATALTDKQLVKFGQLWSQWHSLHDLATQALSSAVNIHGRLQDLADPAAFPQQSHQPEQQQHPIHQQQLQQQPGLQHLVVTKQLAALDKALAVMRTQHEQLQQVVRDMERLYIEASRCLNVSGRGLTAAAVPQGPEPSLVQVVEAMQDMWTMCRDGLLLKVAILGLVRLDVTPLHMATLLQCYKDQPNVKRDQTDAMLAILQQTRQQEQR